VSRWLEFFEGEGNRLSMSRLLQFMAFFPATLVLLYSKSAESLGYFLGAFVVNYVGGKFADKFGKPPHETEFRHSETEFGLEKPRKRRSHVAD